MERSGGGATMWTRPLPTSQPPHLPTSFVPKAGKLMFRWLGKHCEVVSSALDGREAPSYSSRLFAGSLGAMMRSPCQDSEPPMVSASRWVSQITNIALQMALPAGLGAWLDARWGTSPWLVVFGACLGLFFAGASLTQIVQKSSAASTPPRSQMTQPAEPRQIEPIAPESNEKPGSPT